MITIENYQGNLSFEEEIKKLENMMDRIRNMAKPVDVKNIKVKVHYPILKKS